MGQGFCQNLVPNGDFEAHDKWKRSESWDQPEGDFNHFYHADFTAKMGNPAEGKGYHCLCMYSREENEFMHTPLAHPLEKGKVYQLDMMVRLSNSLDDVFKTEYLTNMKTLDWYFTSVPLHVRYKLFITAEPSVSFKFKAPQPTTWTKMSTEYVATGEEEYLTIGNITRIYEKIRADEIIDSLQTLYYRYEKTENRLCDSVKDVHLSGIDRELLREGQPESDFSMNPYIKSKKQKKKKLSRSKRKAYEAEVQKNNQSMAIVRTEQEQIRKKYGRLRSDLEWEVHVQKKQYAVNVCFDNISITEIPGKKVEPPDPLLSLRPEAGNTLVLKKVYFDTDSYQLLPDSYQELDKLVNWMKKNAAAKIQVSGHTDNTGKEKHNLELSANRAKAVKQYLEQNGIDATRIRYQGYAAQFPLADNVSEQGKALNRRVDFTVL